MRLIFQILLFILFGINLYAQNIPNVQNRSIWVKGVKIDGKLDDWSNELYLLKSTDTSSGVKSHSKTIADY